MTLLTPRAAAAAITISSGVRGIGSAILRHHCPRPTSTALQLPALSCRSRGPAPALTCQGRCFTMRGHSADPYSRLLEGMLPFHNSFRQKHALLLQRAEGSSSLPKAGLMQYLAVGMALTQHLEAHHMIEEQYIFPLLAKRLPQFGKEHIAEHKTMHEAVDELGRYVDSASRKLQKMPNKGKEEVAEWPKDIYDEDKMVKLLEHLTQTLLPHLEHEEASLKPESIRAAGFSEQELARIPM